MIYWLTNMAASSDRFYYEDADAKVTPAGSTSLPPGLANFAKDFQSIRPLAERDHNNIVSWNVYESGNHQVRQDAPDLLIAGL